jgi:hypothetical protein
MQIPEKKSSVNVETINRMIKDELYNSKYIKSVLIFGAGVVALFAIGFVMKGINYAAHNFKNLNATLKR